MFFVLSKLFTFILSPFTWIVISMGLFFIIKKKELRLRMLWISLFLILFFSNGLFLNNFNYFWKTKGLSFNQIKAHDNGIVLSGMFEYNGDLNRLVAKHSPDRVWQTIQLYKAKKIKTIVLCGDNGYLLKNDLQEANQLKKDLINLGIPKNDILIESSSKNTHQNAKNCASLFKKERKMNQKNLLITSSMHMRRAKACFDKEGLKTTPFPVDETNSEYVLFKAEWLIPKAENISAWENLIKEFSGYCIYKVMGYL